MKFKFETIRSEYLSAPPLLLDICAEFEKISLNRGIEPVVTRVLGRIDGDSGVHAAHRAVDFRDEVRHPGQDPDDKNDSTYLYNEDHRNYLLAYLNHLYSRKDGRKTVLWHSFNNAPFHFHIQIAPNLAIYEDWIVERFKNTRPYDPDLK